VSIPLDAWWRLLTPPVPQTMGCREVEGLWELVADGTPVGYLYTEAAARWVVAVHDALAFILVELEEALIVRDLVLGILGRVAPDEARQVWVTEQPEPWTNSLGEIVERALAEGRIGDGDEPF
jgi:hypothetical protein